MRYVYTGGEYTEFRGHVFAYGKPTTILDRGTEEAISKRSDFRRVEDEEEGKRQGIKTLQVSNDACPKCGKIVRQGRFMHVKYCRGAA